MSNEAKLVELIKQNPGLRVVPFVDEEVVAGDTYAYWVGKFGNSWVDEVWTGKRYTHIKSIDDDEDVLNDMEYHKDIYELSDDEWYELYNSVPWEKVIIVFITV